MLNYGWSMAELLQVQLKFKMELWLNYCKLDVNLKWNYGWTLAELLQDKSII